MWAAFNIRIPVVSFLLLLMVPFQVVAKGAVSLKKYYHYLYKAEGCVLDKQYERACLYYDSSHKTGMQPVTVDIYNYAVCASYTHNQQLLSKLMPMLALKGADIIFFQKAVFRGFMNSPEGLTFMRDFPMYRTTYMQSQNNEIMQGIKALLEKDEQLHRMPHYSPEEMNLFSIKDDSVAGTLLHIMLANNCLNEAIMGGNFRDSLLMPWPLRDITFRHDMVKHTVMVTEAIKNAIKSGYVKPEVGIQTLGYSNMSSYGFLSDFLIYNDTLWMEPIDPKLETNYNFKLFSTKKIPAKSRLIEELYLDNAINLKKKLIYSYRQLLHQNGRIINSDYQDFIFTVLPRFIPFGMPRDDDKKMVVFANGH